VTLLLLVCLLVGIVSGLGWEYKRKSISSNPVFTITDLAPVPKNKLPAINSSYQELERWFESEETKDAEIKRLKAELSKYQDEFSKLGYPGSYGTWDVINKQRDRIAKLEGLLTEVKGDIHSQFFALHKGPKELPKDFHIVTELTFKGNMLAEWHQSREKF
jgi:hypothetical protein